MHLNAVLPGVIVCFSEIGSFEALQVQAFRSMGTERLVLDVWDDKGLEVETTQQSTRGV
jgi:hypothetical protein